MTVEYFTSYFSIKSYKIIADNVPYILIIPSYSRLFILCIEPGNELNIFLEDCLKHYIE